MRDDERMAAAVKAEDGFFATFLVSSYSPYIVRWAAARRFTPNQVTATSAALALAATAAFATGGRVGLIVGAVLVQLTFTADCVDGQLARFTKTGSSLGAWLDAVSDRVKEFVIYAGLAIGGTRGGDDDIWLLAVCALALLALRHQADFAYTAQHVTAPRRTWDSTAGRDDAQAAARSRAGAAGVRTANAFEHSWLKWVKRVIALPIGERYALISVTAAISGPRLVFQALLVWGGIATIYMVSGRVLRSLARPPAPVGPATSTVQHAKDVAVADRLLTSYRDDGPLALTIRLAFPGRVAAVRLVLAACTVLAAGLSIDGAMTSAPSFVGIGLFVVLGAMTSAPTVDSPLRWVVPPLVHTGQYVTVILLGWRADATAATFALLAVIAYHHYELVYLRATRRVPRPVDVLTGGWDLQMVALTAAAATGLFTGVAVALACWVAALFGVAGGQRAWALARADSSRGDTR